MLLPHLVDPWRATVNHVIPYAMSLPGRDELLTELITLGTPRRFRLGRRSGDFGYITGYCETRTAALLPADWPQAQDAPGAERRSVEPDRLPPDDPIRLTPQERAEIHESRRTGIYRPTEKELWLAREKEVTAFCAANGIGLLEARMIGPISDWEPVRVLMPVGLSQNEARTLAGMLLLTGFVWFANPTLCDLDTPHCKLILTRPLDRAA